MLTDFDADMASFKPNQTGYCWQRCVVLYWLHTVTKQNCDIFHILQGVNANKCKIMLIRIKFCVMCFIEKANKMSVKCCFSFLMAGVLIHPERDTFIRKIVKTTMLRPKQQLKLSNVCFWKYMPND